MNKVVETEIEIDKVGWTVSEEKEEEEEEEETNQHQCPEQKPMRLQWGSSVCD